MFKYKYNCVCHTSGPCPYPVLQTIAVEILFFLWIKTNDFTQNVKYKASDIIRNNLDRFAQKLEVKRVPEAKPPITLKPLKKNQTDYDI